MGSKRNDNRKKSMELAVLNLYSRGYNQTEIANNLHITGYRVGRVLRYLNPEAREELKSYIVTQVPLEWASSIELQRVIIKKAMEIGASSNDARVQLQSLYSKHP